MGKKNRLKNLNKGKRKAQFGRSIGRYILFILLIVIIGSVAFGSLILFETEKPSVTLTKDIRCLGRHTSIPYQISDHKSGIRSITMVLEQMGRSIPLLSKSFPRTTWYYGAGPLKVTGSTPFDSRKMKIKEGRAELIVTARDFSLNNMLSGNKMTRRYSLIIDTQPPRVALQHAQGSIRPGGSGIIVYNLSESVRRQGVEVNDLFFQGFPLADHANRYIAYIALPWDIQELKRTQIVAEDQAGNTAKANFSMKLRKVSYHNDRINVGDRFLNRKIPEFKEHYPEMSGTLLEQYLFANNEIRRRNAQTIKDVCGAPVQERLWHNRFLRMSGEQRAGFADQRTYFYKGKAIDHQVHLGMDIASTANVEIKAANSGKVIFTDYLGIYGNTVILDHGQGIFSLYAHLSRIDVALGDMVDKGAVIAHSGSTGMAGGDHLHFSMLVQGIFVTPKEWLDQHWIDVNINNIIQEP